MLNSERMSSIVVRFKSPLWSCFMSLSPIYSKLGDLIRFLLLRSASESVVEEVHDEEEE